MTAEKFHVKREIKAEGEADTWRANRDRELGIGREEELSEDAITRGERSEGKYNSAGDVVKCNRGRESQRLKGQRDREKTRQMIHGVQPV